MDLTFSISDELDEEVPIVVVVGEIDVATAPALKEHLVVFEKVGQSKVIVDLLAVSFLDSTALGVLVGAFKRLRDLGGELRLVIAEPRILKVFEITDLNRVFAIFPSRQEALRS